MRESHSIPAHLLQRPLIGPKSESILLEAPLATSVRPSRYFTPNRGDPKIPVPSLYRPRPDCARANASMTRVTLRSNREAAVSIIIPPTSPMMPVLRPGGPLRIGPIRICPREMRVKYKYTSRLKCISIVSPLREFRPKYLPNVLSSRASPFGSLSALLYIEHILL